MSLLERLYRFFARQSDVFPDEVVTESALRIVIENMIEKELLDKPISAVLSLAKNPSFNRFLNSEHATFFWKAKIKRDHPEIWVHIADGDKIKDVVRNRTPENVNPWRFAYFEPHRLGSRIAKFPKNELVDIDYSHVIPTKYTASNNMSAYNVFEISDTTFVLVELASQSSHQIELPDWAKMSISNVWVCTDYLFVQVTDVNSSFYLVYSLNTLLWIKPRKIAHLKAISVWPDTPTISVSYGSRRENLVRFDTNEGTLRGVLDVSEYATALQTSQDESEIRKRCMMMGVVMKDSNFVWKIEHDPERIYFRMKDKMQLWSTLPDDIGPFLSDRPPHTIFIDKSTHNLVMQEFPSRRYPIIGNSVLEKLKTNPHYKGRYGDTLFWVVNNGSIHLPLIRDNGAAILMLSSRRDTVCFRLLYDVFFKAYEELSARFGEKERYLSVKGKMHDAQYLYIDIGDWEHDEWIPYRISIDKLMQNNNIEMPIQECIACGLPAAHTCGKCTQFYCGERCQEMDWQHHKTYCV